MSGSDEVEMLAARRVEVGARFIEQAYEHIKATDDRVATLLFVGDICVGVSTRQIRPKATAQPMPMPQFAEEPSEPDDPVRARRGRPPSPLPSEYSEAEIYKIVRDKGPIDMRGIGNELSIPKSDEYQRGRLRRVVVRMHQVGSIAATDDRRYPIFIAKRPPSNAPVKAAISKQAINKGLVLRVIRNAGEPITVKSIGDRLKLNRDDSARRSKIMQVVTDLLNAGRLQQVEHTQGQWTYSPADDARSTQEQDQDQEQEQDDDAPDETDDESQSNLFE